MDGRCQATEVVYEAIITAGDDRKSYIGASEPPFKQRHANHMTSLRSQRYKNATELSKYARQKKDEGLVYDIKWKIKEQAKAYNNTSKKCNLCIAEKFNIITAEKSHALNKKSEMVSKCRHANKFLLAHYGGVT